MARRLFEETREAPPGMVWKATGTHELIASEWVGDGALRVTPAQAKRGMEAQASMGVEPCEDPDCEWCMGPQEEVL